MGLPGINDTDFVLRRYPGIDRDPVQTLLQSGIIHGIEFGAGDGEVPFSEKTDPPGNRHGRDFVISGDHDRADTGAEGIQYSRAGFDPRRIHHGCHAEKGIVLLHTDIAGECIFRLPADQCQYPQTLGGPELILFEDLLSPGTGQRADARKGKNPFRTV